MGAKIIYGLNFYFTFRTGGELFAVNVGNLVKILGLTELTQLPDSPRYFKGILNLFGDVTPVFDGRLKFGFPETETTKDTCILILVFEHDGREVSAGIIVDSVVKVISLNDDQINPVSSGESHFNPEYIHGIATFNGEFVVILNLEKIFSGEEIHLKKAVV